MSGAVLNAALVAKAEAKLGSVARHGATYLQKACNTQDPKVERVCRDWLKPFFQLPDAEKRSTSDEKREIERSEPKKVKGKVQQKQKHLAPVSKFRYYFDQESIENKDSAYVEFCARRKTQLEVVCPAGTHVRRRRYIRVLGTAIDRHMAHLSSFIVRMSPVQMNCVVALGCLGYYLTPVKGSEGAAVRAKRSWPKVKESSIRKELPPAIKYQFTTIWHQGQFWSSYYDLIKGVFRFAQKPSPFKSEIATLKLRNRLVLRPVDFDRLAQLPNGMAIYGEYKNAKDGPVLCFFGTAGDLLSKKALLPPASPGARSLEDMQVYYMDPNKVVALAEHLNQKKKGPFLDPASALQKLPEPALANFVKIWNPTTIELVKSVLDKDANFVKRLVQQVPVGARELVFPKQPTADAELISVFRAMALYPSLAGTIMD